MSKSRRRVLYGAFLLSLLLHLTTFVVPKPDEMPESRFEVRYQPPPRRPVPFKAPRPLAPGQQLERLQITPDFARLPAAPRPNPVAPRPLPKTETPTRLDTTDPVLDRPKSEIFLADTLVLPDFDELALDAVRRKAQEREARGRLQLHDADTTDADSQNRSRARQVVERAIAAMGGRAALLAIREMRAKVWIEQNLTISRSRGPVPVPSYVYPVVHWRYAGLGEFSSDPIEVEVSLDPATPNELYVFRYPPGKSEFFFLFDYRWQAITAFTPPEAAQLRQVGNEARWHFIDRYLGHGVVLHYLGPERFDNQFVEAIRVEDEEYGHFFEAFFSRRTHLLVGVRESLRPAEQYFYRRAKRQQRRAFEDRPPVWTTLYGNYREVQGVLAPHRLERWVFPGSKAPLIVHLSIAYNGQQPDENEPPWRD
ncbi:MAG: hypothetical protein GKR89_20860 [Candidatus Latescibacteria bacterium]|nr:hypothetical protein [Candidatus Latescibacterota bacterium]